MFQLRLSNIAMVTLKCILLTPTKLFMFNFPPILLLCILMSCFTISTNYSRISCHIGSNFKGCFSYADNVIFLLPTIYAVKTNAAVM